MKKITVWLLMLCIVFSNLPATTVFAADDFLIKSSRGLTENLDIVNQLGQEEAAVEWNVSERLGKYTLTYYIGLMGGGTQKVNALFDVQQNEVNVTISVSENKVPQVLRYQKKKYPYIQDQWEAAANTDQYHDTIDKTNNFETGSSLKIGNSLKLRYKLIDGKLLVWTNQIQKGDITPFTLEHEDGQKATINILTGIKDFKGEPVHLNGSLSDLITTVDVPNTQNEEAGSKPGIKVSFKRPRIIDGTTDTFVNMKEDDGEKYNASLVMRDYVSENAIQVNFKLKAGADITGGGTGKVGYNSADNTSTIYFVKDRTYAGSDADQVVEWPSLDSSRMMEEMFLQISGFDTRFEPEQVAYTYVQYTVERSNRQDAKLKIKPYSGLKNTKVIYHVYTSNINHPDDMTSWGDPIVSHNYTPSQGKDDDFITISVPFNERYTDQYYKIVIEVFGKKLNSQKLHYMAQKDLVIPPPTPQIRNIENIYVIPDITDNTQPQAIGFNIEWNAPANKSSNPFLTNLLSEGKLYYELFLYDDKSLSESSRRYSKVFEVTLENGEIVVKPYLGTAGRDGYNPARRYSPSSETFYLERVALKKNPNAHWEQLTMPAGYLEQFDYPLPSAVSVTDDLNYTIPDTYYVTMRAVYDSDVAGVKLAVSEESNPVAVTLDTKEDVIPVPYTFTDRADTTDKNVVAHNITFNNISIADYVENMLEPAGWSLINPGERTYEVYLYQESEGKQIAEDDLLNAQMINQANGAVTLLDTHRQKLRQGGVLRIDYTNIEEDGNTALKFIGLDANQAYYIRVRVRLDVSHASYGQTSKYSLLSKIYSFTTYTMPKPPVPEDNTPPTPGNIYIVDQPNNTTVIVGWDKATFEPEEGAEVYYELVRSTEVKLTQEELKNTNINSLLRSKAYFKGFRYRESEGYIKAFDKSIPDSQNPWADLEPKQLANKLQLTDVTLSPNTIYYYYIRTVYVINGEEVRSQWIMTPVTTSPVDRPIRLRVEDHRNYSYDPKKEVVISFLAPIPKDANVPLEYDFDIAVKGDDDGDFKLSYPVSRLTSREKPSDVPEGYVHMVYKITGLTPGKRYDIKVRTVDKTKGRADGTDYPRSLYSDTVTYRTEFDQDQQDRDDAYEKYLELYDRETEKLRRKPYWTAYENVSDGVYKYRKEYTGGEIALESEYILANTDTSRLYYYFPASMLDEVSGQGTTLVIQLDNITAYIRPYTLTNENEDIKEAAERVQAGRIEDYYIGFELDISSGRVIINGEKALSPKITVDMDVVYLKQKDKVIEEDIMDELNSLISQGRRDVISTLKKELENRKTIDEDRLKDIVDEAVAKIEREHKRDVARILDRNTQKVVSVNSTEKPILLVAAIEGYSVQGYYYNGLWDLVPTFAMLNGFGIEADKLGSYIFAGLAGMATSIIDIPNASNIVAKYTLTDFFKLDAVNMNKNATKRQVYGSIARIIGAPRGADYPKYLQNQGFKGISTVGLDLPIRQDEAIYVIMQAYEKIYNQKAESIKIKNKQGIQNIGAFQAHHRNYVYAAAELRIVAPVNNMIIPSKFMTNEEILEMLSKTVTR